MQTEYGLGWLPTFEAKAKEAWTDCPPIVSAGLFDDVDVSDTGYSLTDEVKFWQNQGQVGSCFSDAITNAVEISISAAVTRGADFEEIQLSRAWVWYYGRYLDGLLGSRMDGGSVSNALRAVHEYGIAPESLWPYKADHNWLERKPSAEAIAAAKKIIIKAIVSLEFGDKQGIKKTIKSGIVPTIGILWPVSWDYRFDHDGVVADLSGLGNAGHALDLLGWYERKSGTLWQILNSHGPIYPGKPSFKDDVKGYSDCPQDGKTYAFWVPDEYLQYLGRYNNREMVAPVSVIAPSNRERFSWLKAAA